MRLPTLSDYCAAGDLNSSYFQGTVIPYVDSAGRLRLARIIDTDHSGRLRYRPITLQGGVSERLFWKGIDKFEFDLITSLPPRWIVFNGEPVLVAPHGVQHHKKGISTSTIMSWVPATERLEQTNHLQLLEYLVGNTYEYTTREDANAMFSSGDSDAALVGENTVVAKLSRGYRVCYGALRKDVARWSEVETMLNSLLPEEREA